MTSTDGPARPHDRHARRRPFANWMKRLANLKNLHADSNQQPCNGHNVEQVGLNGQSEVGENGQNGTIKAKKHGMAKNRASPPSADQGVQQARDPSDHQSFSQHLFSQSRTSSYAHSKHSVSVSQDGQTQLKSRPPTLATTAETAISDGVLSGAGTSATAARTEGDRNSTFSSPAPSVRSVATTLTTVQSAAPTLNTAAPATHGPSNSQNAPHPHPAIPSYLAPHSHPTTYHTATANNALTDDASILTLASSSKRRRRNSLDTNASVRALAPQSIFGGSRESLPLSVLSGTVIHPVQADNASIRDTTGSAYAGSKLNTERASLISASGVNAPTLASERNSYISSKYAGGGGGGGDAASVRSGLLGGLHGRNDSVTGGITTDATPTTKSEKPKINRKSSDLGES